MSRILLIEDNSADVDLLRRAFAAHEIQNDIVALEDGEVAIRFLDQLTASPGIDLIIIDLNIPKHDGIEVLTRYKNSPWIRQIPVAVFTSSNSPVERNRVLSLGVAAYLRKPMELDEYLALGAKFRELLDRPR